MCIRDSNDTYEPGSTFKIITAAAGLEAGVVTLEDRFSCSGAIIVDDRRIRCHKAGGHGAESFTDAVKNSCNPAFITVGSVSYTHLDVYKRQVQIPRKMQGCVAMDPEDAKTLYRILHKILEAAV